MRQAVVRWFLGQAGEWAAVVALIGVVAAGALVALSAGVPSSTVDAVARLGLVTATLAHLAWVGVRMWRGLRRAGQSCERSLAELNRTIAKARQKPNGVGDRELADALVTKNAVLCLMDRLEDVYATQNEAIALAANSSDPAVRARAEEFANLMDGALERP
jgi:hypothetical protein